MTTRAASEVEVVRQADSAVLATAELEDTAGTLRFPLKGRLMFSIRASSKRKVVLVLAGEVVWGEEGAGEGNREEEMVT